MKSKKKENILERKNIIIITASSITENDIQEIRRSGIKGVIKKPIVIEELEDVISQVSSRS